MFIPFLAMGATLIYYIIIIPHFCGFVKRFSKNFFIIFSLKHHHRVVDLRTLVVSFLIRVFAISHSS